MQIHFVKTDKKNNIVKYPYTLDMFKNEHNNTSHPRFLNNTYLAQYNVYPVYESELPEHDQINQYLVRENVPFKDDTGWKLGWKIINKSAEQLQQELTQYKISHKEKIDQLRDSAIYQTVVVQVNETTTVPVDVRQNKPDIQNISGLTQSATLKIINNDLTPIYFRGADDNSYQLLPQEVVILGKAVADKYSAMYAKSWPMKSQVDQATSIEQINSIDLTFE